MAQQKQPIRILHLGDNPVDAELLEIQLAGDGVPGSVTRVHTGAAFKAALAQSAHELAIVDYNLPGDDGPHAVSHAHRHHPEVPVIVVSGTMGEEAAVESQRLGATDFVLKQRPARLAPAVRRALAEVEEQRKRRQAEMDLRQTADQLEEAQAVAHLGSWTFDVMSAHYIPSNEAHRIYGLAPGTAVRMEDVLACVHADDRNYVEKAWGVFLEGESPYDLVYRIQVRGAEKWVHERATMSRDGTGAITRIAGMVQDVTEHERRRIRLLASEDALRRLNAELEDIVAIRTAQLEHARHEAELANRAKSSFLAAMSHEIRTPMNGVIGMLDVLHRSSLDGDQVEMVDLMRESGYALLDIIEDILDYSKIEAGRLDIETVPLAVEDVVEGACRLLDRMASKAGVELTLFVDPGIPPCILGDTVRLRQVLVNLISNAIKFSGGLSRGARVAVRASLAGSDSERVWLHFQVIDNGIGMDTSTISRLFTPFAQADASTTRRFGGTGLGLAISHHLVHLMGGTINVQSTHHNGSAFSLRLPFQYGLPLLTARESMANVAGLRCLVIGAHDGLADDLAAYLSYADATVHRAASLENVPAPTEAMPSGLWVWIIDCGEERPVAEELYARAQFRARSDIRLVVLVVERGQRRVPRRVIPNLMKLDGNVLTRKRFLHAVAMAAGRIDDAVVIDHSGDAGVKANAPSREDALLQGHLILIVDDNETNQKVILQQLRVLGRTADVASNGGEALKRFQRCRYGMVLTDLHMPQMDGYELTAAIRAAEPAGRRTPIVALTANALKGEADRCRAAGMDDYLSKPVPLARFKAILDRWLTRCGDSSAGAAGIGLIQEASPAPPVDIGVLVSLVGNDPTVLRDILADFRDSKQLIAAEFRSACEAGLPAAAGAAAHKLKSSARAIGARALGELCESIELAAAAGDRIKLAEQRRLFDAQLTLLDDSVAELIATDEPALQARHNR
jgi:signal transduction histidine kinase/CheY-like chemotaxis protein/HPt (histidine-containing phosphotransfer) domain-containing protein